MRIIRFEDERGDVLFGQWEGPGRARLLRGNLFTGVEVTGRQQPVRRLLAPLEPVNIIGIGLNYRRHAEESGSALPDEPLVFAKLTSAVIGPGEPIRLPASAPDEVD